MPICIVEFKTVNTLIFKILKKDDMQSSMLLTVLALNNIFYITGTEDDGQTTENVISEDEIVDSDTDEISYSYSHSPVDLFYLTKVEENLYAIIKKYISKLDREPEHFFKRYIADYEESLLVAFNSSTSNSTSGRSKHFIIHSNPIWSYRMIWRYVTDFPKIKNVLLSITDLGLTEKFKAAMVLGSFVPPTEKDLNDSMNNLLTLHDVYDLNLTEFANGIIANVITKARLSAIHCFEIAKFALLNNKQYSLALAWMDVVEMKRLDAAAHPILDYLDMELIVELLEDIIRKHDENWVEEMPSDHNQYQFFNKIDSDFVLLPQKKLLKREYKSKGDALNYLSLNDLTAFSTLCKGGNLQSEKEKSELYCWCESKINPAWYINPQKMELHSKDPYIFQVYDFIGDKFIFYLKKTAIPLIERSTVSHFKDTDEEEKKSPYDQSRTSMYSWLSEDEYLPVLLLSQRIGYLTELITSWKPHTNDLQVAVYATGGYFNVHIDSLYKTDDFHVLIEDNIGDRTATFMLYLNDVELGGNTAFTSAGVAVPPVKGSAVFWYDSKRNGEVDYKAWHGGCPVLLGEKWVANKWIHSDPNMFKRKCTLDKNE